MSVSSCFLLNGFILCANCGAEPAFAQEEEIAILGISLLSVE